MAVAGSLRVLSNAFVNEGGEIEKRKAFVREEALTGYGQNADYKGRITGPFPVPGHPGSVFFRHRGSLLPAGFTAGAGGEAVLHEVGEGSVKQRFWIARSPASLTNFGALMHGASYGEFRTEGHVFEQYLDAVTGGWNRDHIVQDFTDDEPVSEVVVAANANRAFQSLLLSKGYVVKGDILYASAVGTPGTMTGTGAGSLDLSAQGKSIGPAVSLGDYYGQLAVFGSRGIQFYTVDPDFALTQYQRRIEGSTIAPRSVVGYGDGDLVFLGRSGVRSLQARDSSNLARVSDIGSPIDKAIQSDLRYTTSEAEPVFSGVAAELPVADFYSVAQSAVHTETGQLWMALKGRIFVYSRFTGGRINAWSSFDLPQPDGANLSDVNGPIKSQWIADMAQLNETVAFRNFADEVYVYGGPTGDQYDSTPVEVVTPFMDMGTPGDNKYFTGLDLVCEGEWSIFIATRPVADDQEISWQKVAEVNGRTRGDPRITLNAQGTQIALRLTCSSPFAARLAQVGVFFRPGAEK